MKGTIVSTWMKTCRKLYGDNIVNKSMESAGWNSKKIFTPLENIDDSKVNSIILSISKMTHMNIKDLWKTIGIDNLTAFHNDFPSFFENKDLYSFLKSMYDVHVVMTKRFSGAKPPLLTLKPISKRTAEFTYTSKRGMFDYFLGLLEGSKNYFNEKVSIKELERSSESLKLELTFDKDIYFKKTFLFSKILSLGFIRSIPAKSALFSFITSELISLIVLHGNLHTSLAISILFTILNFISASLIVSPYRYIKEELSYIKDKNFKNNVEIESCDFFEDLMNDLNAHKNNLSADFTNFKSITDEMENFANVIKNISKNMNATSSEISETIEQVAECAVSQAENTEKSVSVLNNNVNDLKKLMDSENINKEKLEKAINNVDSSHKMLSLAGENLINVMEKFKNVNDVGLELNSKINKIFDIVAIVSGISKNTNLLSLNASIESARAGEMGKGFGVVAGAIRKLASESENSVNKISSNISSFSENVSELIQKIASQYEVLKSEVNNLETVRNSSSEANSSIQNVSASMLESMNKLNDESKSIEGVYENIESLAAIAQENSASSEEVSASVSSYTNEINKLTENIGEFQKIALDFKSDLEKYHI